MWHPDMPDEYKNQIVTGDARELAKRIPDESIDLIFTDPPYPDEFLWCWEWMALEAKRILKETGCLLSYVGNNHLPFIFEKFGEHLKYYWMLARVFPAGEGKFWSRNIFCCIRPILCYTKNRNKPNKWTPDVHIGIRRDKRFHEWGQSADTFAFFMDKFTNNSMIVLDPFAGGGTVPAVCKQLNRNYTAFEIDPETAKLARERVRNTQPPLFVVEPEQLELLDE